MAVQLDEKQSSEMQLVEADAEGHAAARSLRESGGAVIDISRTEARYDAPEDARAEAVALAAWAVFKGADMLICDDMEAAAQTCKVMLP